MNPSMMYQLCYASDEYIRGLIAAERARLHTAGEKTEAVVTDRIKALMKAMLHPVGSLKRGMLVKPGRHQREMNRAVGLIQEGETGDHC